MIIDVNVLTNGWTIAGVIASFFVAVVALGIGVASILHNQNLQKRDRKERLLNEIIEWAEDVSICGLDVESAFQSVVMVDPVTDEKIMKAQAYLWDSAHNMESKFHIVRIKGEYIRNISRNCGGELSTKTKKLLNLLDEHNQLFQVYQNAIPGGVPQASDLNKENKIKLQISENTKLLRKSVGSIIEEAAKEKLKDVGEDIMSNQEKPQTKNELTLKDIEDHLKLQDKLTGSIFGASLVVAALTLWITLFALWASALFLGVIGFMVMFLYLRKKNKIK